MNHVFYHSSCYDGFGSAFAHWKNDPTKSAQYHAVSYGYPPPDVSGAELHILDFSYPAEVLDQLAEKFECIQIIDHHKTAQENLEKYSHPKVKIIFDMTKSGALLSWEHFVNGGPYKSAEVPRLIQHISDRDLWKFEIPGSKEVHKSLVSLPMDFEVWDKLDVDKLITEGVALERMYTQLVENICKSAWVGKVDGQDTPMVNTSIAWSEVGHRLLEKYPKSPFVASFTVFNDQVMWSLRSREDFDVSAVARKMGGGGHKQAAGFKTARF